ncbi:siderophore biosynthesis protein [Bdellovibrio bacteriovorus]|uniref:Siderophore biosynthesis protein n=1 Tax=Bdellovibrio bacteriovorus TaxID=959 RepID=A0A150WEA5_BDEBC|nr:GNAT family N-acetyltransferase [Bdellovibrio bacteriovorus]KYG61247.1 siderophore biosynthesis protein [Bdellovibrio bacteriovorus]
MLGSEFEVYNHRNNSYYAFRPLSFDKDIDLYCKWMQQPYVAQWWGRGQTREDLTRKLISELEDSHQLLYIGLIDGVPVSYWERYWISEDVLGNHIQHESFDQGLHFLIGEPEFLGRSHTSSATAAFMKLIFSDSRTQNIIGEPDIRNKAVLTYAEATCFVQREIIQLPERTSAIMVCERERFFSKYSRDPRQLYRASSLTQESSVQMSL